MQVSKLHANFLINNGSANFQQATQLIKIVKQKVQEKFSVNLELEVKVIE
jgi:UDP-N-acetylmuramate dehydrogenase